MKDLLEISCGLDVHKEKIVACILTGPLGKPTRSEIREFSTLIPDMIALRNWIVSKNCHHVAMESTGIYWMPIYEILEDAFSGDITLLVVNARHMKNVPGKKTDMRDSEWISTLLRAGLLNGSFIPEKRIREFRDLNRYRKSVIRDITSQKNRIEKFLQSSGFRLSSFISDIFGASGRNIILHLIEHGQIDKTALDSCLKTKTRNRIDEILMSVNGTLSEHQKAFLRILMTHYDSLKKHLAEIETSLEEDMAPFALQVEQLNSIYGISTTASCAIIAEIGIDMKPFKTAEHICSWPVCAQVITKVLKTKKHLCHKRQSLHKKYALRNCLGDCRETQHLSFGMVLENQTEKRSQKSDCRTCPKTSCHHLHNVKTRNSI